MALTRPLYNLAVHHMLLQQKPWDDARGFSEVAVKEEDRLIEAVIHTEIAPYVGNARAREILQLLMPTVQGMAAVIAGIKQHHPQNTHVILRSIISNVVFVAVTKTDPSPPHELLAVVEQRYPHGQQHKGTPLSAGPAPKKHKLSIAHPEAQDPDEAGADSWREHDQCHSKETSETTTAKSTSHLFEHWV